MWLALQPYLLVNDGQMTLAGQCTDSVGAEMAPTSLMALLPWRYEEWKWPVQGGRVAWPKLAAVGHAYQIHVVSLLLKRGSPGPS